MGNLDAELPQVYKRRGTGACSDESAVHADWESCDGAEVKKSVKAWAFKHTETGSINLAMQFTRRDAQFVEHHFGTGYEIVQVRITEIPPKKRKKK